MCWWREVHECHSVYQPVYHKLYQRFPEAARVHTAVFYNEMAAEKAEYTSGIATSA